MKPHDSQERGKGLQRFWLHRCDCRHERHHCESCKYWSKI